jgi:hypothetical protein
MMYDTQYSILARVVSTLKMKREGVLVLLSNFYIIYKLTCSLRVSESSRGAGFLKLFTGDEIDVK